MLVLLTRQAVPSVEEDDCKYDQKYYESHRTQHFVYLFLDWILFLSSAMKFVFVLTFNLVIIMCDLQSFSSHTVRVIIFIFT